MGKKPGNPDFFIYDPDFFRVSDFETRTPGIPDARARSPEWGLRFRNSGHLSGLSASLIEHLLIRRSHSANNQHLLIRHPHSAINRTCLSYPKQLSAGIRAARAERDWITCSVTTKGVFSMSHQRRTAPRLKTNRKSDGRHGKGDTVRATW